MAPLKQKGDLAELMVAADLRRRGLKIAFPYGEDWDYDLIVERRGKLERVQVKHTRSNGEILVVQARSHSLTKGRVRSTKRYTSRTIDWLAAYDAATSRCYYIPADALGEGMSTLTLRLTPARNGQILGVRAAADYLDLPA
jgi:PD-(D/E)XK nuclease superfamily protein